MWDLTKLDCLLGRWSSNFCPTLSRPGSSPRQLISSQMGLTLHRAWEF